MSSSVRAFGHVLLTLTLTVALVLVPFRAGGGRADALPAAPGAMHAIDCGAEVPEAKGHMAHGGMLTPTLAACSAFFRAISIKGWTATASSSAKGHSAGAALTGGTRTWWQSKSRAGGFRAQTLVLRTRSAKTVNGLQYQPAGGRGSIGRFEVRLSADGRRFGAVVAAGRWQQESATKQVGWSPAKVRAVKITIRTVSPARSKSVTAATLVLTGIRSVADAPTSAEAVVGRWGPTIAFPLVPVAVAAIPRNRLVVWAADEPMGFNSSDGAAVTQTAVLDLATGAVSATRVSDTGHDMFCPGISLLADGRILVTGGISNTQTSIYDPKTDGWSVGPRMNIGRGYQGQTTLSGGGAFTIGGSWSGAIGGKTGEVYTPNGVWRVLPRVTTDSMLTADIGGVYRSDNHAWLVASSNGNVLQAGPSKQMNWISTSGDGSMTPAGTRGDSGDQMNGNAVLFDADKLLTVGGASSYENVDPTGAADVVDFSGGFGRPVTVTKTGSLARPRSFANSVVLPDGSVLTVGGMARPVPFSDTGSVLTPELWNPISGTWSAMADAAEPRNYHSVATLLPDGTVFSGGGGLCGAGCATNHPTGQIFSPPYLFASDGSAAVRPTISAVPAAADPGQDLTVTASSGAAAFVLIRASAATHSVDNDQRRVPLAIRGRSGDSVTLVIPDDNGVVLPGRYMLFALTKGGVPSISAPVTIGVKG